MSDSTGGTLTKLDHDEVLGICRRAIHKRLAGGAPFDVIIGSIYSDDRIFVHVNSNGNAIACRSALWRHGWLAEPTGWECFGVIFTVRHR